MLAKGTLLGDKKQATLYAEFDSLRNEVTRCSVMNIKPPVHKPFRGHHCPVCVTRLGKRTVNFFDPYFYWCFTKYYCSCGYSYTTLREG